MRRVVITAVLLIPLGLVGCSDGDEGDAGDDRPDGPPTSIGDLRWDVPYEDTDISICSGIAVHGPVGETPTVVDTDTGKVVQLAVALPDDAPLEPDDDWNYSARCQDTPSGEPVVLVEWQEEYLDPEDEPPTVYAGFDASGRQLWVRAGAETTLTTETGRGVLGINVKGAEEWTFLDTLTGDELGTARIPGRFDSVPEPIDPGHIVLFGGEVVAPDGAVLGELPGVGTWTPVDDDRILFDDNAGLSLLELSDLTPVWTTPDHAVLGYTDHPYDPTTGVLVVDGPDDRPVGLDVETGEPRWSGDVEASTLGVDHVGGGVATFPDDELEEIAWVDTATGEVIATDDERYLLAGPETAILVDDGTPAVVDVEDLR